MIEVDVGGTIVEFPDGTAPDVMKAALSKRFGQPAEKPATFQERFDAVGPYYEANPEPRDHGRSQRQQMSAAQLAINPVTSYPETYARMNQEARDVMSAGADQVANAQGIGDVAKGVGKTALGAVGYVASPINAAYRSIVGQPVEDVTGIPREYTEFAAQLATPGLGMVSAGKAAPAVKAVEQAAPSIQELKAAAKAGYQSPEVKGLAIQSPAISNFSQTAQVALNNAGIDANIAPKTFGILANLEKVPEGAIVTGDNLNNLRKIFGNAAKSIDPAERLAASRAIEALDNFLPSLKQADVIEGDVAAAAKTLETARGNYSAAKHAETIDNKTIQAELRAAAANSGRNVANTIRQRMADILINPKQQRGFNQSELDMMEQIVRGTTGQNALRIAGNVTGGGGGIGAALTGGGGALALGPVGMGIPIAGYLMKSVGNKMTLRQAEKLSEAIRSRAPLASSAEKWEVAADGFSKGRNARSFAAVALAARNLSTNLKDAGFNISPSDLMKSLQGPMGASADNEQ